MRGGQRRQLRQDQGQRDEGEVADDQVEAVFRQRRAEVGGAQGATVDALDGGDGRVAAQLRVQLAVPNIDADYVPGARLQQAIGEAAGRLPDVEAVLAADAEAGLGQRPSQLEAAARDVMRVGVGGHGQRRFLGQFHGRLADRAAGPADPAGLDQPLRRSARRGEVLGDEQGIRPYHPGGPFRRRLAGRARLFCRAWKEFMLIAGKPP